VAAALTAASSFSGMSHGVFANNGWITGDPWNSGLFIHAKAGGPEWPPGIENQRKIHWNSKNGGKPCAAAAGDYPLGTITRSVSHR
jgi:hypothetical protein